MKRDSWLATWGLIFSLAPMALTSCTSLEKLKEEGSQSNPLHEALLMMPEYAPKPPERCLSLSGGGMRAATYAIGAMKALSEFDELDSLDIISGVSGGTYAMLWYYTGMNTNSALVEQSTKASSKHLFTDANLQKLIQAQNLSEYIKQDALNAAAHALATGFRRVKNPIAELFDNYLRWRLNDPLLLESDNTLRSMYAWRLKGLYTSYAGPQRSIPSLIELDHLVRTNQLPWPILNATAFDVDNPSWFEKKRIFEVTPLMIGSDAAGYAPITAKLGTFGDQAFNKPLIDYVTASGAALDIPVDRPVDFLRNALGIGLGMEIYPPTDETKTLYLSDGGFSENLGAYALARRGCKLIIIADAEFDPKYQFEAYHILKGHLKNGFHVNDIETNRDPKMHTLNWQFPVMEGSIKVANESLGTSSSLKVRYMKLSVDGNRTLGAFTRVKERECATGDARGVPRSYFTEGLLQTISFDNFNPQISTLDQFLSSPQVKALIDLGYAQMKAVICQDRQFH